MSKPVVVTFPSGRVQVFPATPIEQLERKAKPLPTKPRGPCKHIGAAINIPPGCGGSRNSVWECGLHGQCAPLSLVPLRLPDVVTCRFCDDHEPAAEPGILKKALRLATALGKWEAAGKPTRTQEEVDKLFSICAACPYYARKQGACGKCGCPVNRKLTPRNKLYLKTEACPLNPPLWTADVTAPPPA